MTLRERAASYRKSIEDIQDALIDAEDRGFRDEIEEGTVEAIATLEHAYKQFCSEHGFRLLTDASGLFLRCAETGIPLVIGDEYIETYTGECVLVKRAA
jgi:hypothetical protein